MTVPEFKQGIISLLLKNNKTFLGNRIRDYKDCIKHKKTTFIVY